MQETLKILVVRFSSIGDIVLTTPVVRVLKKQLNTEVHYLTKSSYKSLLVHNPYVDKLHLIKDGLDEVLEDLKAQDFDYVIDLHNNLRTKILKFKLNVPAKSFNKLNMEKFFLTTFKIDSLPRVHIVDRYLSTIAHLGAENDNQGLDFFLTKDDEVLTPEFEAFKKQGYVVFVIGGQHATKILPTSKIISIIDKLKDKVVIVGGPEDNDRGEQILAATSNTFNACGKFSISQSAYIVKEAEYVITHDTGMMHIAAAFKKKIYAVWGNTVPEFGMTPYKANEQSKMIEVKGLNCRPCSKIGYDKCPKGHFKCMQEIEEGLFLSE